MTDIDLDEPSFGRDKPEEEYTPAPHIPGEISVSRHLDCLQRVTCALTDAVSVADVRRIVAADVAGAAGARYGYLAVAEELDAARLAPHAKAGDCREPASPPSYVARALLGAYESGTTHWPTEPPYVTASTLALGARRVGAVAFLLAEARALAPAERALLEDLTRQVALAVDRARMYEIARREGVRAEQANLAKDEVFAVLGHELRNPLSPILTALTLMRSHLGDVALKERLIIERQLQHMVRLVDDLLDVSRITRGSIELACRPIELHVVVQRAVEIAEPILNARSHRLSLNIPGQGARVHVDPHRMAQALANLLTNAAKYTRAGGLVEVLATVRDERVLLSVRDNGKGIDSALLPRIFEPFVQRQQSLARSRGGLGLGLTITRHLVELHGGTVSGESGGLGKGSTFSVDLPLAESASPSSSTSGIDSSRSSGFWPSGTAAPEPVSGVSCGVRVMVVDDNVDAAEMLADALRAGGHVVSVAHDGPAALHLADAFRPELALLDIGLPVMDGFDLAERLRARLNSAPPMFVAVTGYGRPADRARTQQCGFDEHLVKPIDLARLGSIMQRVILRRSA